ncbi:LytTR family transcriptional regulator [Bacteroides sp. OttesenSCG-928-D19]|nr:LytTR family transcriptional regulator [Bacteroides sp. OttesenSCG-928-D19]
MNLFNEYRKSYITVCFVVAVIYAFSLGGNLPIPFRMVDGLIYSCLLCLASLILWNVFRFAIPTHYTPQKQLIFLFIFVLTSALFITGTESLALYLCFPTLFDSFADSIPARSFISLLIFIIIRLLQISYHDKNKESDKAPIVSRTETIPEKALIDRITVRSGSRIKIIPIDEICYIKADGDYISIHTSEGNWLKEQTMKHTEKMLPTDCFVRIHRSYIVNIHHISRIERYGEKQQVVLHNQEKIKISAARYRILKQILGI